MQSKNSFNNKKSLNKTLIIILFSIITIIFSLINLIRLINEEVQIFEPESAQIKENYSAIENNIWDISENDDGTVTATLSEDGTLNICGNGKMKNYGGISDNPQWFELKEKVKSVIIEEGVTNIGWYTFSRCTNLSKIEIPNTVTEIGFFAFEECTSLTNVKIPNSVTTISGATFIGCTNITSIEIPNGVTDIGWSAFRECTSLASINIPNTVTSIGEYAFYECTGLASIEIPSSVTNIAWYAFSRCTNLNNIKIHDGVISIAEGAFQECTNLKNIKFPNSIINLGNYMFDGCRNLMSIEVAEDNKTYMAVNGVLYTKDGSEIIRYPEGKKENTYALLLGTKTIGRCAFERCISLTNIVIPESVNNIIADTWLCECTNLISIEVDENNKNYKDINGVLYTKDGSEIIKYPQARKENIYEILAGARTIGNYTFEECRNLTTIEIPNGVTSIGDLVFEDCTNLTNIVIPNSVTNIGFDIFHNCPSTVIYCTNYSYARQYAITNNIKYVIDEKAPILTSVIGNSTEWTNKNITLTINAEDVGVGLAKEPYSFDGGKAWQAENTKTYTNNSSGIVIKVKDKLNNIYTHDTTDVVKIDKQAPQIGTVTGNATKWTNKNVTLTIIAKDSVSGLADKPYSFDGGKTWQAENTKTYTSNSASIVIKVKDKAGNVNTYNQKIVIKYIDKKAPTVNVITNTTQQGNLKKVTLTIKALDSLSGLADKPYSFDGGKTWQAENTKTYTKTPIGTIIKVKDKAGNIVTYSIINKLPKL